MQSMQMFENQLGPYVSFVKLVFDVVRKLVELQV